MKPFPDLNLMQTLTSYVTFSIWVKSECDSVSSAKSMLLSFYKEQMKRYMWKHLASGNCSVSVISKSCPKRFVREINCSSGNCESAFSFSFLFPTFYFMELLLMSVPWDLFPVGYNNLRRNLPIKGEEKTGALIGDWTRVLSQASPVLSWASLAS